MSLISGLILCIISIIYLILYLILANISLVGILIFLMILLTSINMIYMAIISNNVLRHIKKNEPNYIIKEKYGFDENVL